MIQALIEYAFVGAMAGGLAGLLGIGGGIIIIPSLFFIFSSQGLLPQHMLMQFVVGTSLAAIITTTLFSLRAQYQRGVPFWPIFSQLAIGIVIGTIAGVILASYLNTQMLKSLFGVFMVVVAIQMFFRIRESKEQGLPGFVSRSIASLCIGLSSGLLGISGGALTIPYLTYYKISIREAMASSTACGVLIAITGTISFMIAGWGKTGVAWSAGYVYWPAALMITLASPLFVKLGNALSHRLPVETLRKILALFICLVGIQMLFSLH